MAQALSRLLSGSTPKEVFIEEIGETVTVRSLTRGERKELLAQFSVNGELTDENFVAFQEAVIIKGLIKPALTQEDIDNSIDMDEVFNKIFDEISGNSTKN